MAGSTGPAPRRLDPARLLAALSEHRVDFVVIGGMSLAAHGYVRATRDLDIVPEPSPQNRARLAAALRELHARVDIGGLDPDELGLRADAEGLAQGGNWVLATDFGRLDVLQDVTGLRDYAQLAGGAIELTGVRYAGYDELVAMKSAAGRPEDLRDLGALRAARGE